jgi:hypothetical protein
VLGAVRASALANEDAAFRTQDRAAGLARRQLNHQIRAVFVVFDWKALEDCLAMLASCGITDVLHGSTMLDFKLQVKHYCEPSAEALCFV